MPSAYGLGLPCGGCGCGTPCPECRHYTADDCWAFDTTNVATITVNGVNIPIGNIHTPVRFAMPGIVATTCCEVIGDDRRYVEFYRPYANAITAIQEGPSGCWNCKLTWVLAANICGILFYLNLTRVSGDCTDVGGALTQGLWQFWFNSYGGEVSSDCLIEALEWLSTFTIGATITYDPCECPP